MNDIPFWLVGIEGEEIKRVIMSDAQALQVVAGPGSGKTTGLKRRVQRLVVGDGVPAASIYVGTFTRAVTRELREALASAMAVDERTLELPKVSTLHSQALKMLREFPGACPGRTFRFLLEHEIDCMLYDIGEILGSFPDQAARQKELRKIQAFWAGSTGLVDEAFRGAVETWLREHGGMIVNEVVSLAVRGLRTGDIPQGTFRHVIVDEYQDLTQCEQMMVELLKASDGSVVVLGDDDQSIYGFRFNHPGGISEFPLGRDPSTMEQIGIQENRRCGDNIVDIANRLMASAGSTKPPMLPRRGESGTADLVNWESARAETDGLAAYIRNSSEKRFLVLVPRRFIGYRLKDAIGEDAATSFHEQVLESSTARNRFALASLLADPDDDVALRAWLGFEGESPAGATKRNSQALKSLASVSTRGFALLEGISSGSIPVSGAGKGNVRKRAAVFVETAHTSPVDDLGSLIGWLFDPAYAAAEKSPEKQALARKDLESLRDAALAELDEHADTTLAKIVNRLRYAISTGAPLRESAEARVQIMTLHGAKGLEADCVVVAGLADQILPGEDKQDPIENAASQDEQRRLLYVSITRARIELILSWPKSILYRDAIANGIRIDQGRIWTDGEERVAGLSSTRFLPTSVTATAGRHWLHRKGLS